MELFRLFGSILVDNDKANDSIAKTDEKANNLGKTFLNGMGNGAKAAGAAVTGMAVAVGGAAVAVGGMMMKSAENADQVQTMAEKYGLSAERIQELTYAGTKLDVSIDSITGTQSKLIKAMAAAEKGTGSQADAFKQLGISVVGSDGHLRDSNQVFTEALDKLHGMSNITERNALSMQLFGKSAMDLNPLINAGGKELAKLTDEAHKTGAVISNEANEALDKFGDNVEALKLSGQGLASSLMSTLMPQMQGFIALGEDLAKSLGTAVKTGNFDEFGKVLSDGLVKAIDGLSKGITKFVPVVTKVLTSIIGALIQAIPVVVPALTDGVVQIFNALIDLLSKNGEMLINAAATMLLTLIDGLVKALPKLIPLAVKLILALVEALVKALPQLIDAAIQIILGLVNGIIAALPTLIKEAPKIIKAIVNGLLKALPQLIDAAIAIIMAIVDFLTDPDNIGMLIQAALEIVIAIDTGLIQAIPKLIEGAIKLIGALVDKLINYDWGSLGASILQAISNGLAPVGDFFGRIFQGAWNNVVSAFSSVGSFFQGVWNNIVGIFGKIGTSVGDAIGGGFKAVINSITGFAEDLINGFIRQINNAIGLINDIPGVQISLLKGIDIPKMSIGTRYLPGDMLIQAHEGEMIVPKSENPYANSGNGKTMPQGKSGDIVLNTYIDGNLVKTTKVTSEQLALSQRQERSTFRTAVTV